MRYVILKPDCAAATLEAMRREDTVDERRVLEVRGFGDDDIEPTVLALSKSLYDIKTRYPDQLSTRDPSGGKFEAEACAEVHRAIPFDPQMLGDYEFWTWLAVFHFRKLIDWRHGGGAGRAAPLNFGINNRSENLLYRMWLRGDSGFDANRADAYELARRGDQDFWRSHVFRQGYGKCRALVKALIRYQYPDASPEVATLKILEIRELAKRLKRLHPNLLFECLDDDAAYSLIEREAQRAKSAVCVVVEAR